MNQRPPQLSRSRLLAALTLPLVGYLVVRALIGSATGALAVTEAIPATWLLVTGITRRRLDPIAVMSTLTVAVALAAYALSGGDPLALELRRGAVTGTIGVAALASVALGRPLLMTIAEHAARLNPDQQAEAERRLRDPDRRRAVTMLTALAGGTLAADGVTQIALALTVPARSFVADSTAVRILVLGTGLIAITRYLRREKDRRRHGPHAPRSAR